jgi:hypothetical protein
MVTLTFTVTRVQVLQSDTGPDTVFFHTTEPTPYPKLSQEPLMLKITVEADKGPEYVDGLGIPVDIVEVIRI